MFLVWRWRSHQLSEWLLLIIFRRGWRFIGNVAVWSLGSVELIWDNVYVQGRCVHCIDWAIAANLMASRRGLVTTIAYIHRVQCITTNIIILIETTKCSCNNSIVWLRDDLYAASQYKICICPCKPIDTRWQVDTRRKGAVCHKIMEHHITYLRTWPMNSFERINRLQAFNSLAADGVIIVVACLKWKWK